MFLLSEMLTFERVFIIFKETLIKAVGIVSDPRKCVTEWVLKRFNQRFLKITSVEKVR